MGQGFAAQVANWVHQAQGAAEVIFQESVKELVAEVQMDRGAGGNMPVDVGFLRNSLTASTAAMPAISPEAQPVDGMTYAYNPSDITAVIAGAELGQTVFLGYTAAYAARLEYGFDGVDSLGRYYSQQGYGFVRKAAQSWPTIVARQERRLGADIAFAQSS